MKSRSEITLTLLYVEALETIWLFTRGEVFLAQSYTQPYIHSTPTHLSQLRT